MRTHHRRLGTGILILATFLGIAGGAIPATADDLGDATPAVYTAPPPGSFVKPAHVWADPTHPDGDGNLTFAPLEYHVTLAGHWAMHSQAPRLASGVTHCSGSYRDFGASFQCRAPGIPRPGEYELTSDFLSEAGDRFDWTVPLTVCPLTGCSDLFSVNAGTVEVCPGADLASAGRFTYDFNLPWNASTVVFAPLSAAAGGEWEIKTQEPADNASFWLDGSLEHPGDYPLGFTVTDEFGGEHDATATVRVLEPTASACAQLASTGDDPTPLLATAVLSLALGVTAAAAARRRSRVSR